MAFPDWIEPMAATLTAKRFADPAWTFERKLDGIRVLAFKNGGKVELWSRNRLPLTGLPGRRRGDREAAADTLILDGEATGGWGRQGKADYHVFDVLWLDGADLRPLPLDERRATCDADAEAAARRVPPLDGDAPWERACRDGWEGVIAKRRDSPYESPPLAALAEDEMRGHAGAGGRRLHRPAGRRVGLGALLVGYFENDDFVFAGKVGTGFDNKLLTTCARGSTRCERKTRRSRGRPACRSCASTG